jgi:hypothetical protein
MARGTSVEPAVEKEASRTRPPRRPAIASSSCSAAATPGEAATGPVRQPLRREAATARDDR